MPSSDDFLPPELVADAEARQKVARSTISLTRLVEGRVRPGEIERAFSALGCGAVLAKLDVDGAALYERFYRLQWQLGNRVFANDPERQAATVANFAAMDLPVRRLLLRCGVGVARARRRIAGPGPLPEPDLETFLLTAPLSAAVGRPLASNRQEFHPSVAWLLEQERKGELRRDETPVYSVVAHHGARAGATIMGRIAADEERLLALYREWKSSGRDARRGHGNKLNGDVYYGAFRGRTHVDGGGTMTVLLGPGELRDHEGFVAGATANARELGGNLMVVSPGEERLVPLPYRLPCGSPYVVVFFEKTREPPPASQTFSVPSPDSSSSANQRAALARRLRRAAAIDTAALGWTPTVHGVRRIENEGFSRGQAVMHVTVTDEDLA